MQNIKIQGSLIQFETFFMRPTAMLAMHIIQYKF